MVNSVRFGTGEFQIQISGNLTGCTPIVSADGLGYFASAYITGNYVVAFVYAYDGTKANWGWHLTVVC